MSKGSHPLLRLPLLRLRAVPHTARITTSLSVLPSCLSPCRTADRSLLQPPNQWTPPPPPSAAGPPSYAYQQPQFYGSGPPPPAFGEKASYAPPPPPPQHQPPPPQQIVVQHQQPPTPTEEEKKKGRFGRFGKQMGGHVAQGAGFGLGAGLAVRSFSLLLLSCSIVCAGCSGSSISRTRS